MTKGGNFSNGNGTILVCYTEKTCVAVKGEAPYEMNGEHGMLQCPVIVVTKRIGIGT